jgi:magnesium transporter
MQVYHFAKGQAPVALVGPQSVGGAGFFWLDVERSEQDWHERAQAWLGARLHERHVLDTLNETHPPYHDGTEDYDLLVVRTLCPDCPPEAPTTRPVALIITARAVVSVRPPGDPVFTRLRERLLDGQRKSPNTVPMLLYLLIDQVVDSLLVRRDVTSELLTRWQERLLDRSDQFNDWQSLMRLRAQLRRLEVVTESQVDALDEWREQTARQLDGSLAVRFNDLREHLLRIYNHASVTQHDIDALVQIYFSANTQRTNDTLQFLAVVSAIFLPLNLLAGLFGMNFTHMPLLGLWYGPWLLGATMLLLVLGLLLWFRRRTWV